MNEMNLGGDKIIPEKHSRQPWLTYNAWVPFTKNKKRMQKLKEKGNSRYIYQNELVKACFQHGMAYGAFKDLTRRTASDKIFCDKAFNIAKNPKYDGYQRGLTSIVYNFFDKKFASLADKSATRSGIKNKKVSKKELAEELHKPLIKNSRKEKYTHLLYTIFGVLILLIYN